MIKLTFLGTGTSQGIPVIGSKHPVCLSTNPKDKRLRTSALISINGKNILIDCGPDFRIQMLNNNCAKIDAILFTHEHNDHVSGLDDVRPLYFLHGDIPIYANKRVIESLKYRFNYIFNKKEKIPGSPNLLINEINDKFNLYENEIIVLNAKHGNLKINGFRIGKIAYYTDVKYIPESEFKKLFGLDVLVINSLRIEEHYSHYNLKNALELIRKIKPKRAYLTHVSHKLGFHDDVQESLPNNVFLAYDGLQIKST